MCRRRCWHPVVLLPDARPPDDTCGCFSPSCSEFCCCFLFIVLFSPHNEIFIVLADIWRECSNLTTALLNEKSWVKEVSRSKLKGQEFVLPPPERESHIMAAYNSNIKKKQTDPSKAAYKTFIHRSKNKQLQSFECFQWATLSDFLPVIFPLFKGFVLTGKRKDCSYGCVCENTTGFLSDCQIYLTL